MGITMAIERSQVYEALKLIRITRSLVFLSTCLYRTGVVPVIREMPGHAPAFL